jgi:hypothetical protein
MKGVSIIWLVYADMMAAQQNCRVGAQYPARTSKPLTNCGKEGLCDERGHGSRFWCGICCKQG